MTAVLLDVRPANWATVEAAAAGDRAAFTALYEQYHSRILTFIRYRVRHTQLAEDLTHDVFVRALLHIGTVTWEGRDIGAWLTTIARNRVLDHIKSSYYRTTFPAGVHYDDGDSIDPWYGGKTDQAPPVDDQIAARDTRSVIIAAVRQLTVPQQQVILLRFLEEQSVAETGAVMELNDGAVKSLTSRALRALARLLEGAEL